MTETQKFVACVLVVFLLYAAVYLLLRDEDIITSFNDIILVIVSFTAAVLGYSAAKVYGWSSLEGKIFYVLSTGILFLSLGELSWMFYEVVLGLDVPYPSIADLFWLLGLILVCVSLYVKVFSVGVREQLSPSRIIKSAVISFILLLPCVFFVLIPILSSPETEFVGGLSEKIVDLAYPLLDILAMFGALGIYATHRRGTIGTTWGLIILALLTAYIFDVAFSYLTWKDLYYTGHIIDLLYFAQYLLFVLAFGIQKIHFRE